MRRLLARRPSPAMVVALLALFVALGGASYAALKLPKNSVGTKQLKRNAVVASKIKKNAVNGSKVANGSLTGEDLSPSTLSGYAKTSDLNGYLKGSDAIPGGDLTGSYGSPQVKNSSVGPDKLAALPTASLEGAIYNVSGGGGIDCEGTNSMLPDNFADDIDFSAVAFDNAGIARHPNPANPNCFNGFLVSRAGTYVITAWIGWEANGVGDREIELFAQNPGGGCCGLAAYSEQAANDSESGGAVTAQTVSGIARLQPNAFVGVKGRQSSGGPLGFFGGNIQIAWIGP